MAGSISAFVGNAEMNFRSYADLARTISMAEVLSSIRFDVVVGVPRSGMVPASMIALHHNKPVADLEGFVSGRVFGHGQSRACEWQTGCDGRFTHALVVDDCVNKGRSLDATRRKLAAVDIEATYLAVYARQGSELLADFCLESVALPRIFEWNMWHSVATESLCVDLDGVLCRDAHKAENDDGDNYRRFISEARPLFHTKRVIDRIVTSRLEKYRPETEAWLAANGFVFNHLHMLDLPSASDRRRLRAHAPFKAEVFRSVDSLLFVESEPAQAEEIASRSGKCTLDYRNKVLLQPDRLSAAYQREQARGFLDRVSRGLERRAASLLSRWKQRLRPLPNGPARLA